MVALRAPLWTLILFVLLAAIAIPGAQRIQVDDSLSQLFHSDTAEFREFEKVSRAFLSSEYDVLVVIEGKTVLQRESVEKLRALTRDLQLAEGARGVISMFSAREPPVGGSLPKPLFPDPLPEGARYEALVHAVKANELIRGKLLSEQGDLALVVLSLEPSVVAGPQLASTVSDIRRILRDDLQGRSNSPSWPRLSVWRSAPSWWLSPVFRPVSSPYSPLARSCACSTTGCNSPASSL